MKMETSKWKKKKIKRNYVTKHNWKKEKKNAKHEMKKWERMKWKNKKMKKNNGIKKCKLRNKGNMGKMDAKKNWEGSVWKKEPRK